MHCDTTCVTLDENLGKYGEIPDKKSPFKLYIFPRLTDPETADQLRDDINSSVKLKSKDNDLYRFKQSKDLKTEIPSKKLSECLHSFIDMMLDPVKVQLEMKTGRKLSDKNFDITASRYDVGNYLLCHNDDIKDGLKSHGRALAFIYYLTSRLWTKEDGGALILYDSDDSGEPVAINNRLYPRPNTLVVFETTPTSWHSVQEVFCKDDFRLSINGWFHADGPCRLSELERTCEPCPYTFLKPTTLDERLETFFRECVNHEYLMEKTCFMIRKQFKRKSEINLTNFLVKKKFDEISEALKMASKDRSNLIHVGPYNKRNYHKLKVDTLPPICKDLYDAFRSDLFFMLLSRLTGLDLQPPSLRQETKAEDEDESDEDEDEDEDDEDEDEDEDEEEDENEDEDEEEDEEDGKEDAKLMKEAEAKANKEATGEEEASTSDNVVSTSDETQHVKKLKTDSEEDRRVDEEPTTSKETLEKTLKKQFKRPKNPSDPLTRLEFRHLESGSYTLIHDHAFELGEKSALDVMLHFNHSFQVNFDDGGYISYIDGASEEDLHDMNCELLTVEPKSNCLSLVYRCDEGTCRFLKHINKSHNSDYQDLYCVYYERVEDLPNHEKCSIEK